ncbi:class I SAM-dependent methyltransferase [Micromonospora craniellae]|uniref:Class I SAM-dependent methyltransferase n=1 Tax=Micromonospora craniellae TaxID=2294034 RepID=A0A372FYU9_9ACTN|nr:class I SAM-dependent methyltransferase [Micromonospora craniellae]QOC93431.1 class I SAM-dependent methyltransferase [Micromonospora craniellae]RFS45878.1 class I SAM-dependent methyltransferase [Micromonospora craniellae]
MSGQLDSGDVARWRRDWNAMMHHYQPGRDDLLVAIVAAVEELHGRAPERVLDIGGGPGATAEVMLRRWPDADVTVLDIDPVLLALAEVALPQVRAVRGDLGSAQWLTSTDGPYDVVLALMTVHYLSEDRVRDWYAEVRQLLRPGGVLLVADVMRDPATEVVRRSATGPDPWTVWWRALADVPPMASMLRARAAALTGLGSAEFVAPVDWHRRTAQRAGLTDARLLLQRAEHALMAFHRPVERR